MLDIGDRFYMASEKKRTVYEVIDLPRDMQRQLLSVKICEPLLKGYPNGPKYITAKKAAGVQVVFLRNIDDVTN